MVRRVLGRVFFNDREVRAGWRILAWLLTMDLFFRATGHAMGGGFPPGKNPDLLGMPLFASYRLLWIPVVFAAACVVAVTIEHRPVRSLGLALHVGWSRNLALGVLGGLLLLSLVVSLLVMLGAYHLGVAAHSVGEAFRGALAIGLFCILVAVYEEFFWRGYLFQALVRGTGIPIAVGLTSLLFLWDHRGNPGESPIGLAWVGIHGLISALLILRTGSLWAAIGLHAAWDWGQNFLYGTPDSGVVLPGSLLQTSSHGDSWLSGGSVGPEGSILTLAWGVAAILVIERSFRIRSRRESGRSRRFDPGPPALDSNSRRRAAWSALVLFIAWCIGFLLCPGSHPGVVLQALLLLDIGAALAFLCWLHRDRRPSQSDGAGASKLPAASTAPTT